MKNILLITNSRDITADYIVKKYGKEINIFRLNVDLFSDYKIIIKSNPFSYSIQSPYGIITEHDINSILFRKPELNLTGNGTKDLAYRSIYRTIYGITELFEGPCLTKPSILSIAENKIVQLKIANDIGLKIPASIISNDRNAVNSFVENKQSVFKFLCNSRYQKGISKYSLGTNIIKENEMFEGLDEIPVYFQEYQSKNFEIRANIIGKEVISVKILSQQFDSTKTDWRNDIPSLNYELIELPDTIISKLIRMMKILNIDFGIFDLIYYNNEYCFLEVNPNGQWLWLETKFNLGISQNIINYLVR